MHGTLGIAISSKGRPIGEDSPSAKWTDHEVETIIELRESGMTIREISKVMEIPKSTVHSICSGRTRSEIVDHYKFREKDYAR